MPGEEYTGMPQNQPHGIEPRWYALQVNLPGISRENIMVALIDGCVEIHCRTHLEELEVQGPLEFEVSEVVTRHRVPLPADADTGKARVTLRDGLALIEIPRRIKG